MYASNCVAYLIVQTTTLQHATAPGSWNCDYFDDVDALRDFGSANTGKAKALGGLDSNSTCLGLRSAPLASAESLAELLASFFHHWAAAHDYRSAVVTIRRGIPLTKAEKGWCDRGQGQGQGRLAGRTCADVRILVDCYEPPKVASFLLGRCVSAPSATSCASRTHLRRPTTSAAQLAPMAQTA